jgi:hypothetical protein
MLNFSIKQAGKPSVSGHAGTFLFFEEKGICEPKKDEPVGNLDAIIRINGLKRAALINCRRSLEPSDRLVEDR